MITAMGKKKAGRWRSQSKTIKSFAAKVFRESSVAVVSNIVSTVNVPRRIFRTLVLLLCMAGFLYQCSTYLQIVLMFPTTVDIDIKRPQSFMAPAFTFCNNNGIMRSKFCAQYPNSCMIPDESFCQKYYGYCGNNRPVPLKEFYYLEEGLTLENFSDLTQDLENFLTWNKNDLGAMPSGPYARPRSVTGGQSSCYTLHSLVNSFHEPYFYEKAKLINSPITRLKFDVDDEEVFIPGNQAGVIFSIHSPYVGSNPFENGFFLKPGRRYIIHIDIEEEVLMEYPYDTDCNDYFENWEESNRTEPATQEMCRHKCMLEAFMKCVNCSWSGILYPHDQKICPPELVQAKCSDDVTQALEKCTKKCKADCWKTKYRYDVQERFDIAYFLQSGDLWEDPLKVVYVDIYVDSDEVLVLRHKPKYLGVEIFSSIGGFIGGWLGISLVEITDFVECVFRIIIFAITKLL